MDGQVEALTPAQFLTGQKFTTIQISAETKSVELIRLWRNQQALQDSFFRRCSKECLSNLINYHEKPYSYEAVTGTKHRLTGGVVDLLPVTARDYLLTRKMKT
ncbi:hypothetical protein AVEN_110593-1 [Araneus ventricosus]|uniref:Uncharacterized protein n=1 Tax=Araneus ventricosus TaxID=182803 RepID=A0A4Y2J9W3_ARAVE|nr:hypothetical protein AVEN_110593-1 [Araneus ventricosus]